jgi:hypothetical protein
MNYRVFPTFRQQGGQAEAGIDKYSAAVYDRYRCVSGGSFSTSLSLSAMAKKIEFNMELVKKYIFWAVVPIGIVLAVFSGWIMSGTVAKDFEARKKQLESGMAAAKKVLNETKGNPPVHPNDKTAEDIQKVQETENEKIFTAWKTLAERQRENKWDGLNSNQAAEVEKQDFLSELNIGLRQHYFDAVRGDADYTYLNNLFLDESGIDCCRTYTKTPDGKETPDEEKLTIDFGSSGGGISSGYGGGSRRPGSVASRPSGSITGRPPTGTSRPGTGGRNTPETSETIQKGKVFWSSPRLPLTADWKSGRPESYEVWLTQEEIWVYKALLSVVAKSNAAATEPKNAVVKQIDDILIGKSAAQKLESQSNRMIGGSAVGTGSSAVPARSSAAAGRGGAAGNPAEGKMDEALSGRYVDGKGLPLISANLAQELSKSPYRRMPVYLKFMVDRNRIPALLAECANCSMPIDVLWVNIGEYGKTFDFSAAGAGGGSDSPRGRAGTNVRQPAGSSAGSRGQEADSELGDEAVPLEIYGCMNIFAPPDLQKIGTIPQ